MNKEINTLKIRINEAIDLLLVVSISGRDEKIIMENKKMKFLAVYENVAIDEAKQRFAEMIVDDLTHYAMTGRLTAFFKACGIKLLMGQDLSEEIKKQAQEILEEDKGVIDYHEQGGAPIDIFSNVHLTEQNRITTQWM